MRISDWSSDVCSSDLWVQAAVLIHWRRIAPPDAVAAHLWVALKHEITYRKPAFLEDQIVATVMLEKVQRESAFYETVIKRGEEVLAEVKSRWCCLDANTLRPARLARAVVDRFFPTPACVRSEARRVGKACVSTFISRWSPDH